MRNPDWVHDEIILAMDLYVQAGRKQLPPGHEDVLRLSHLLNELPIHPKSARGANFRNPNGISMILGNFLSIDPQHYSVGLLRNNQLQASVWKYFIDRPNQLRIVANAIRHAAIGERNTGNEHILLEDEIFPEGKLLTKQHCYRERNRSAVVAKIDHVLARDGRLVCEVCGFDFSVFYGELGQGFAECHHVVPLAEAAFLRMTRLADLSVVCSNCHRMLHRGWPPLTVEALRCLIARQDHGQRE